MKKIIIILLALVLSFNTHAMTTYAEDTKNEENEIQYESEQVKQNIVVALDPGHDAKHAGATANGLLEHILTLKIANYCKEELEKYDGVEVYMTREVEACPYPNTANSGKCIEQRVIASAKAGARIYVSMHLNAQPNGTKANGAEIIIPNMNWKESIGVEGKQLAQNILDELVNLGLTDRGMYTKNTTIGEIYEDGSVSDYYAVHIYGKQNDVTGVIVEHAFMTNINDVNGFLKTEERLKALGVADAKGIINYLGLSENDEEEPVEPEEPEIPEEPEQPVEPEQPEEPDQPEEPNQPEEPEIPELPEEPEVLLGDVNDDGFVDIFDVQTLFDHIMGVPGKVILDETLLVCADVNEDGFVDIFDVQTLFDMIMNE